MLMHPTLEKLQALRLFGMKDAFQEQLEDPAAEKLTFEERLALLVDREETDRADRRLARRLKRAKLREQASMEDIDYTHRRGLNKPLMQGLASCRYIREHNNVIFVGPTGTGKTYLACALAHKACLEGFKAEYHRLSTLLAELEMARGDGRFPKVFRRLSKTHVLILDDWGLDPLTAPQRRDLLELLDDRHGRRSTIATSQFPVDTWHKTIGDATLGDAILDRIVHNAYKITLKGESMRKRRAKLPDYGQQKPN